MDIRNVMIVDDEPISILISEKSLKLYRPDLAIVSFTMPSEGLVHLEQHRPDLLFLDVKMPVMDGFEFLEAMKAKAISVPVVLLTSSTSTHDFQKSAAYPNLIQYQIKPLTPAKLVQLLAT